MRHAGNDQVMRRGDAGDRLAMLDMAGDQSARQGAHPDLVAAVADRDGIPRPGREQLVERGGKGADVLSAHVARGAVGAAPAAFDRYRMSNAGPAPSLDRGRERGADRDGVDRDLAGAGGGQCNRTGVAARLVGGKPARHADLGEPARQQGRADRPVGLGRRRRAQRHKNPVISPTRHGRAAANAEAARHSPPLAASHKAPMLRPTSACTARSISATTACGSAEILMAGNRYRLASLAFKRSVISIEPGAWVMQNSGSASAMTACGVTPHAQNTGNSPSCTGTASP